MRLHNERLTAVGEKIFTHLLLGGWLAAQQLADSSRLRLMLVNVLLRYI